ncbi:hypothetical protein L1987_13778 [Smallanthus sonchifolius]|uniref:Uncharacterized protein n=1 Tax=Smallanthus sonchifolius TaxID=185202 RepID=A0ACB9JJJ6_9ASTR|nr:hypothetical protein L1987_13778 [Smallanthus sonchifolius]
MAVSVVYDEYIHRKGICLDHLARTQSSFGRGPSSSVGQAAKRRRGPILQPRGEPDEPRPTRRPARVIRYAAPEDRPTADTQLIPLDARILSRHTLLRFELATEESVRSEKFVEMEPLQHRSISWELIEQLGQRARIKELLGARWMAVLAWGFVQYKELTVEFH